MSAKPSEIDCTPFHLSALYNGLDANCRSSEIQKDLDKRSKFASILDTIERVTGFDLDGDGTVAGDVLFEVCSIFNRFSCRDAKRFFIQ